MQINVAMHYFRSLRRYYQTESSVIMCMSIAGALRLNQFVYYC